MTMDGGAMLRQIGEAMKGMMAASGKGQANNDEGEMLREERQ